MPNPQDVIRDTILRHLNDVRLKSRSPKSAGRGIMRLVRDLKTQGLKQQEVASNLDYLVQKGWVREDIEHRSFTTSKGTTQTAEKRSYKISDIGVDRLESASTYRRPEIGSHVNITNIHGVTVVGEGNVVNVTFTELARVLNEIGNAISATPELDDQQKLNIISDIESLQAQLQKPEPNRSIVRALWKGIEGFATVGTVVELIQKARPLIAPLL